MASEFRYDRSDKPALLRQVASSLSHDLRTPIRHSGQFLDLYEKDLAAGKSDTAETHLSVVKESIAQTLDMVSAIVSYTRLGMTLNAPTALDLKDTANAARDRVLLANPSANIASLVVTHFLPNPFSDPSLGSVCVAAGTAKCIRKTR